MKNKDIYEILAAAVKKYRLKYGWSQEELSERTGLHPSFIGQIERNKKKISLATLQKLAKAFNVKISDLLKEEKPLYKKPSWEEKMAGLVREKSSTEQRRIYYITKSILKFRKK